jgi:hypothetical protein
MSYESMAREDSECDFPGCNKCFDSRKEALCAIIKDGGTKAFCAEHSNHLIGQGVQLRTLEAVHEELNRPKKLKAEAEAKARKEAIEKNFINSLK